MSSDNWDTPEPPPADQPGQPEQPQQPNPDSAPGRFQQEVRHQPLSAVVPDQWAAGVFATGVIVLQGRTEFVLDFVQALMRPHRIAARVVLPIAVVPQVIAAMRQNVTKYQERFGPIPALPKPPAGYKPPPIQDLYDELKMADHVTGGAYANAVLIAHTAAEFAFDFIGNYFPRSVVNARVYLSAPQVPRFLDSLTNAFQAYQRKIADEEQRRRDAGQEPAQE